VDKDRLAVVENSFKRITIRDLEGRIEKEFYFPNGPLAAHLLPGGNILVVFPNEIQEIKKDGRGVFSYKHPAGDIYRACKLRDNLVAYVTSGGMLHYLHVDAKNSQFQPLKSFSVGAPGPNFGGLDGLPNGNVLVPVQSKNLVVEYDPFGKIMKRFPAPYPVTAVYMPNGHILVGSQFPNQVSEINRQGKTFWTHTCDGSVYQVNYH
jgi:hypothetical protein